jgi:hypothetical protein
MVSRFAPPVLAPDFFAMIVPLLLFSRPSPGPETPAEFTGNSRPRPYERTGVRFAAAPFSRW